MNIKISNIQGLIPFKVFICDGDFEYCELLDSNFRKTTFEMEYTGESTHVGIKIITSNNKEYKQVFSQLMELFIDCPLEITTQTVNPTPGLSDGTAGIQISNCYGVPNILWSDGQTTLVASNLSGGTYSVIVTDTSKENCFKTEEVTLYEEFYIQVKNCESINFSEFISENNYQINWGSGFVDYDSSVTNPSNNYLNVYNGVVTVRNTSLLNIKSIVDFYCVGDVTFETKELKKLSGLTRFETNTTYVKGVLSELPSSLERLVIKGDVIGDCSDLPTALTALTTYQNVMVTGDTLGLPRDLITLSIGKNQISGAAIDLPVGLTGLTLSDFTSIDGSTYDLPRDLVILVIKGSNTIYDIVDGLPPNLEHCEIWGSNMVSGLVNGLPFNLKTLILAGNNSLSGDVSNLPISLTDTLYLAGQNVVGGDISTLPSNLQNIFISGIGTIPGEIITGDIDTLNSSVVNFTILGNNEITGQILSTSSHDNLLSLDIEGNNTITGNTANLPQNIQNLKILGQNNLNIFTGGSKTNWAFITQYIIIPVTPFSSEYIGAFLQSLVTLKAKPNPPGYIKIKGYLDLNDEITKTNYDYLISEGFNIVISPTL